MKRLCKTLAMLLLALALMFNASGIMLAQTPTTTTTVQDTVYRADGTPAAGQVIVSWNTFTTASGTTVPAGSTTATIDAGGVLSLALAPNAGSTPMGAYYTAVFHLNDGTTSREFWVVPVTVPGGGPAKLATIRNQVLPTSVAMQTVSKQYVDSAIAAAAFGFPPETPPVFGPSGTTHAVGAVPDPGATAGNTRFLREDGTWVVPSGSGGGSPTGAAGGDLSGTYPNPAVAAVHATSGTLNNVVIGATTPVAASFTTVNTGTLQMSAAGLTANSGAGNLTFAAAQTSFVTGVINGSHATTGLHLAPEPSGGFAADYVSVQAFNGTSTLETVLQAQNQAGGTHASLSLVPNGGVLSVGGTVRSGTNSNTDLVGTLVLPAGSTTSASYTFNSGNTSAPVCMVQPQNATPSVVAGLNGFSAQVATTGLSITAGSAPGSAVTFGYVCAGRN